MLLTILLILCILFLLVTFLLLPGESLIEQREPYWGANIAHRGLHSEDNSVPENSLVAFTAAVEAGYGIELDLQLTKDGEVVIFHDDTLARACGETARVDSYTLAELRNFRLFGTSHRIPMLREVLALVNGDVPLVIELKSSAQNQALCQAAWKILRTYDGDFCVESFDPRIVRWFKKNVPGILRGQLASPPKEMGNGMAGIAVGLGLTNFLGRPQFIAYRAGPRPFLIRLQEKIAMRVAWTCRSQKQADELENETDAIIFEYYTPVAYFKQPPDAAPALSDEAFTYSEDGGGAVDTELEIDTEEEELPLAEDDADSNSPDMPAD